MKSEYKQFGTQEEVPDNGDISQTEAYRNYNNLLKQGTDAQVIWTGRINEAQQKIDRGVTMSEKILAYEDRIKILEVRDAKAIEFLSKLEDATIELGRTLAHPDINTLKPKIDYVKSWQDFLLEYKENARTMRGLTKTEKEALESVKRE